MKDKLKFEVSLHKAQTERKVEDIAREAGLVIPSSHTAIFLANFMEIETANRNGVRLSREAVEKALPGLKFSQINFEHDREDMVGVVLDAWIEGDSVFGAFTFAKNLFPVEFEQALEQFEKGELGVSFELLNDPDTQEILSDKTRRLHDIDFQGMGLLIANEPAYPTAKVLEQAYKYINDVEKDCKEAVFASKIKDGFQKMTHSLKSRVEEVEFPDIFLVTTSNDKHFHVAEIDSNGNGQTISGHGEGKHDEPHMIRGWQVQEAESTIADEPHTHAILDEIVAKIEDYVKSKNKKEKSQKKQGGKKSMELTEEQKAKIAEIREELGDFAKDVEDEKLLDENTVDALRSKKEEAEKETSKDEKIKELESRVQELESTLEAKESEVEQVRENAEKIGSLKVELKDNPYVKDFKDEDFLDEAKVENARIKYENDQLKAEREELEKRATKEKAEKDKKEEKASTKTGSEEENESDDDYTDVIDAKVKEYRQRNGR